MAQSCDLDANRMNRSDRRNALAPEQMVKTKPRKSHGSTNLSMSTYVRNDNAFSVIQKDIASGQSKYYSDLTTITGLLVIFSHFHGPNSWLLCFYIGVIGQNRRDQNRIKNLAALIGDKKAFDSAFNKSVLSKPTPANLDSGTNLRDS